MLELNAGFNIDKERDLARNRTIKLDNGTNVKISRKDPFGFWSIHYERGYPPVHLQGNYTSFDDAFKALKNYIDIETNKKIVEVDKGFGIKMTEKDLKK